jgi:hypothetical protein
MKPSGRAIAAAVLVGGAAIGTLADRIPERAALRAGEYWVLTGDFHVHAFPGDGALAPWALRFEAARGGLDVIGVTNHNQSLTGRLAEWVSSRGQGPLMLAGQEITNPEYHMIAVGIERAVDAEQPAAGAMGDVHAQGGVAVAAHPSRRFHGYDDDSTKALLDGAELAHADSHRDELFRADIAAFFEKTQRVNPDVAAIGSSDFHAMPPAMGRCRTYLFVRERTKQGVLEAIRSGRTLAVDGNGVPAGNPSLVQLLGAVHPVGRIDPSPAWRRFSMALSWFGAFGLVVFAGRRR